MTHSWRDSARPIIAEVIQRVGREDRVALKRAIRDAYPFGERKYWPYKAWLSEVRAQLGGPIGHSSRMIERDRRQGDLFGGETPLPQLELAHKPEFDGAEYVADHDQARLTGQIQRVFHCIRDGRWRTLSEIAARTGDPQASISAQLRHLRKPRFGSWCVEKRARGERSRGLFEYRLTGMAHQTGCDKPGSARDAMPITPAAGAPSAIPYAGVIRHL